tara:strand:+ start:11856 stop:12260 length:405 start_codon:yes stop_codon:yes gene_type:complete
MNKIALLLRSLTGGVQSAIKNGGGVEAIAKIIDEYKLTDEEIMKEEAAYENQLTARLQADMASDNWLAKSVRPIGFIVWTIVVLLMIFADGNFGTFEIKPSYLPLIETVYVSYLAFYVGSRGVEKTIRVWKNKE